MAAADVRLRRVLLGNSLLTNDGDYNETQALILSPVCGLTLRRPAHDFPGEGVTFMSLLLFHHHVEPTSRPPTLAPSPSLFPSMGLKKTVVERFTGWWCGVAFIFERLQVTKERIV